MGISVFKPPNHDHLLIHIYLSVRKPCHDMPPKPVFCKLNVYFSPICLINTVHNRGSMGETPIPSMSHNSISIQVINIILLVYDEKSIINSICKKFFIKKIVQQQPKTNELMYFYFELLGCKQF